MSATPIQQTEGKRVFAAEDEYVASRRVTLARMRGNFEHVLFGATNFYCGSILLKNS